MRVAHAAATRESFFNLGEAIQPSAVLQGCWLIRLGIMFSQISILL